MKKVTINSDFIWDIIIPKLPKENFYKFNYISLYNMLHETENEFYPYSMWIDVYTKNDLLKCETNSPYYKFVKWSWFCYIMIGESLCYYVCFTENDMNNAIKLNTSECKSNYKYIILEDWI